MYARTHGPGGAALSSPVDCFQFISRHRVRSSPPLWTDRTAHLARMVGRDDKLSPVQTDPTNGAPLAALRETLWLLGLSLRWDATVTDELL